VVLESSNDQDHADANGDCHGSDASGEAVGSDSNELCFKGLQCKLHAWKGVAQIAIHSQDASQGTGVDNVHGAKSVITLTLTAVFPALYLWLISMCFLFFSE
jgi:hypothetical protein